MKLNFMRIILFCILFIISGCSSKSTLAVTRSLNQEPPPASTITPIPSRIVILTSPTPSLATTSTPSALMSMVNLKRQFEAVHLKPGWLHLVSKHSWDVDNDHFVSANPGIFNSYLHLDENLQNYEDVTIVTTLDGRIFDKGILKNGQYINLITGEIRDGGTPSTPDLFWGAVWNFTRYESAGNKTSYSETTFNGEKAVLFQLHDPHPFSGDDYKLPAESLDLKAYFTPEGKILQLETIYTLSDGSVRIFSKAWDFIVESNIIPPPDILVLLK